MQTFWFGLSVFAFFAWLFIGIHVLFFKKKADLFDFGLLWIVAMFQMFTNMLASAKGL